MSKYFQLTVKKLRKSDQNNENFVASLLENIENFENFAAENIEKTEFFRQQKPNSISIMYTIHYLDTRYFPPALKKR